MKRKISGDRFEYFKEGKLWYWHLFVSNSPSFIPAAQSGKGYPSEKSVLRAIEKARYAATSAKGEPHLVPAPTKSS
jgi:hypothetical protein